MEPLAAHQLWFGEQCVPFEIVCDFGTVRKLRYAMIFARIDGSFGVAGVEIGVKWFAPAADG